MSQSETAGDGPCLQKEKPGFLILDAGGSH